MLKRTLLALALALAPAIASAQTLGATPGVFNPSAAAGGSATITSGTTTVTGGTNGVICEVTSGKIDCTSLTPTDDSLLVGNGTVWQIKALTTCTGAGKAVTYDASTNTFGCNTIAGISGLTTNLIPEAASATSLQDSAAYRIAITNDTGTGTTDNKLTKFTSGGNAVITSAAETAGILGVVKSGGGTSGSAVVTLLGGATCVSDNATTAGHYAGVSASVAGDCTDLGSSTFPSGAGTQVVGVWSQTASAGANSLFFGTPDVASASSGGGGGGNKNPAGTTGNVQLKGSGNQFAATSNFSYDATNFRLAMTNATTASDNSADMVSVAGTLPASPSTSVFGLNFSVTGAGSASQQQAGGLMSLNAGYTGSSRTEGFEIDNLVAGTGTTLNLGNAIGPVGNIGGYLFSAASTAGLEVGGIGEARSSTYENIGIMGKAPSAVAGTNIGVLGTANSSTEGTNLKNVAGWFTLDTTDPATVASNTSVALVADGAGSDIFRGYNAGTLKFTIGANGDLTYGGKLTISDINAESSNFTVGHRIHYVTTGSSTITATTPASPTVGDTYTVVKADSGSGTVVWTRAGSQTLNGATTRTVSAQYKSDTCVYMASNVWICQGDGA
jgi:hypothetical protein